MEQSPKLFVLIDRRLSRSQQAVQACHAVAEFAKKYPDWIHRSMVLLAVDGRDELEQHWLKDRLVNFRHAAFHEPYYDNHVTAIACHGVDEIVKDLRLL